MRAIMQAGIRPLLLRLYDADDTAFNGYDLLDSGGCLLVVATAGVPGVARAEAEAVTTLTGGATHLGAAPPAPRQDPRSPPSADRVKSLPPPPPPDPHPTHLP